MDWVNTLRNIPTAELCAAVGVNSGLLMRPSSKCGGNKKPEHVPLECRMTKQTKQVCGVGTAVAGEKRAPQSGRLVPLSVMQPRGRVDRVRIGVGRCTASAPVPVLLTQCLKGEELFSLGS